MNDDIQVGAGPSHPNDSREGDGRKQWTFLSTHAQVLLCLCRTPGAIREVASNVGISGRAVQLILRDLEEEGYITCTRVGRRNHYELHLGRPLRHPLVSHREVSALLSLLSPAPMETPVETYS